MVRVCQAPENYSLISVRVICSKDREHVLEYRVVSIGRRPLAYLTIASIACVAPVAGARTAEAMERVIENGTASWYGGRHVGRTTSSGEVFRGTELTAAHPYLPLGSTVRVTVADTGSSVVVRINDRQPASTRRVIDLSREAASRLGMLSRGTARVTIATTDAEPVEVAMAPDDVNGDGAGAEDRAVSVRRRGRPHRHRARPAAVAARPSNHAPSVVRVRHSAQRPAIRHTL